MLSWLQANLPTIIIIAGLILFFSLLLLSLIKDKKKGKSSCCGGCAGCAMAGQCHTHAKAAEEKEGKDGHAEDKTPSPQD